MATKPDSRAAKAKRDGRAGPAVSSFLARQPIFDARKRVFGYELLFRAGPVGTCAHGDGDQASRVLIANAVSVFGLESLTRGGKAFVNFTRDLLLQGDAYLLPARRTVVEVLETVVPDGEVIEACRRLKRAGYQVAMDDFTGEPGSTPLTPFVDIIKVDFRASSPDQRRLFAERFLPRGIKLLAEKVETWEEWREAAALGYAYFQGFFFCKPETLTRRSLPPSRLGYLRLVEELSREEVRWERVEAVIREDAPLALKLLSYMNSALFGRPHRVTSIRHAAVLIGRKNLRRWANLAAVMGLGTGKPPELVVTCLVRARFCELLGQSLGLTRGPWDLFLIGLLSSLDAILDRPLDEALSDFGVSREVRAAVLGDETQGGRVSAVMRAYEGGDWVRVAAAAGDLGLAEEVVATAYRRAVAWASAVCDSVTAPAGGALL
jgi:EAL and modified HD-GYP domain-containing signal transduction protein